MKLVNLIGLAILLVIYLPVTHADVTSTEISTKIQPTTTIKPKTNSLGEEDTILSFNVSSETATKPCLSARFSLAFDINYDAYYNNSTRVQTSRINVTNVDGYHGTCEKDFDTLIITFNHDWVLVLNYTLKKDLYSLNITKFKYTIDRNLFPNATNYELGKRELAKTNMNEFSVNTGKSYKCYSKTRIHLNENVTLQFKNYQAQAFISEDSKTEGFDTAVECIADIVNTSKLVPILVGVILTILIILVLIAYIVGRRRYRPTYQQV